MYVQVSSVGCETNETRGRAAIQRKHKKQKTDGNIGVYMMVCEQTMVKPPTDISSIQPS